MARKKNDLVKFIVLTAAPLFALLVVVAMFFRAMAYKKIQDADPNDQRVHESYLQIVWREFRNVISFS